MTATSTQACRARIATPLGSASGEGRDYPSNFGEFLGNKRRVDCPRAPPQKFSAG